MRSLEGQVQALQEPDSSTLFFQLGSLAEEVTQEFEEMTHGIGNLVMGSNEDDEGDFDEQVNGDGASRDREEDLALRK